MPAPVNGVTGAPCWIDLLTGDVERSRAFYTALFGWEAESPNDQFGGYFNFTRDGLRIAGGMPQRESGIPDVWSVYLATSDAKQTVDAAAEHGGHTMVGPMDVATLGTMAIVSDSGGAAVGMWQAGDFTGFGTVAEHGAPGWFELHTRDYDAAVTFYREVFGWTTEVMSDTPEFRYTILTHGDQQLAGIMDASSFLPAGVPAHWEIYFAVDDTDAAVAQLEQLGGAIVMPAEDTPYGRVATATDPTGALFRLVGPNEAMPAP